MHSSVTLGHDRTPPTSLSDEPTPLIAPSPDFISDMAEYLKTEYNTPGTTTAATSDASTAVEQQRRFSARSFLSGNVDTNACFPQLLLYCFLTGFTSAPTFLACYVWCGFQSAPLLRLPPRLGDLGR